MKGCWLVLAMAVKVLHSFHRISRYLLQTSGDADQDLINAERYGMCRTTSSTLNAAGRAEKIHQRQRRAPYQPGVLTPGIIAPLIRQR
jgi:hypothetical protein